MNRLNTLLILSIFAVAAVWAVGCAITSEDESVTSAKVALVTMAFEKAGDGSFTDVELHVTGNDFSPIDVSVKASAMPVVVEVTVPAGKNRTFYVLAKNSLGDVCYEGSTTVDLNPGAADVDVEMAGRAYIEGVIYLPYADMPSETLPSGGSIQFQIDGEEANTTMTGNDGTYEMLLPTDSDSYRVLIETVHQTDSVTAYADVDLTVPGDRVEMDLYLISKADVQNPWICAVNPMTATGGDQIHVYGRGFDKAAWRPYLIAFDWDGSQVSATNIITVDDTHLILTVPSGAANDLVVAGDSGAYPSNKVPF